MRYYAVTSIPEYLRESVRLASAVLEGWTPWEERFSGSSPGRSVSTRPLASTWICAEITCAPMAGWLGTASTAG